MQVFIIFSKNNTFKQHIDKMKAVGVLKPVDHAIPLIKSKDNLRLQSAWSPTISKRLLQVSHATTGHQIASFTSYHKLYCYPLKVSWRPNLSLAFQMI